MYLRQRFSTRAGSHLDAAVHQLGVGLNDSSRGLETIRVNVKDSAGVYGMTDSDFGFITTIIDSA